MDLLSIFLPQAILHEYNLYKYDPVIVLITSDICPHSKKLLNVWEQIHSDIYSIRPITVHKINCKELLHGNDVPKGLKPYEVWFPMILLVPGLVWNLVMSNLGQLIEIKQEVKIFNGKWKHDNVTFDHKYIRADRNHVCSWFKDINT